MSAQRVAALEQMLARVQKNRQEARTGVRPSAPAPSSPPGRKRRTKTPLEQAMTDSVEMKLPQEPAAAKAPEPPTPAAPPAAKAPEPPTPAAPPAEPSGPAPVAVATPTSTGPVAAIGGATASAEPATFGELMARALGLRPR